jgi:putative ABC transport system ATP-binding protein
VTHDPHACAYADRLLVLADGRIVDDVDVSTAHGAAVSRVIRTARRAG